MACNSCLAGSEKFIINEIEVYQVDFLWLLISVIIIIINMSVTLHIELFGDLKFELFCQEAPKTCRNFLALCASGYYNGSKFHRNIRGFIL